MKTKNLIYVGCLFLAFLVTGCKKYDLSDPEQFMYGKWKITHLDTCSKDGVRVEVLKEKGIFYFHKDLTCNVKYTGREPFGFGKTFYWTRISTNRLGYEMYTDSTLFPTELYTSGEDFIDLQIYNIELKGVYYHVELTRM